MRNNLLYPAFILMVIVQLFVPSKMIYDSERVLESGKEFKFITAPIDPSDPLRGKYITLNFQENTIEISDDQDWNQHDPVFVLLATDQAGYAKIQSVSKLEPREGQDYLQAIVNRVVSTVPAKLIIEYPFNRYYLEEFKADKTEKIYLESLRGSKEPTFALVSVKNGKSLLKDVFINGVPIREINFEPQ